MRQGSSPLKRSGPIKSAADVSICVMNSIPDTEGYFAQALDVLKLSLASIRDHADREFDLLLVDNGSCQTVVEFLQGELAAGRIDHLILNRRNIGAGNGLLQLLRIAPGRYIFFSDGDIYYRPGWMETQLRVMKTFPRVGVVGGVPVRGMENKHTHSTTQWAEENPEVDSQRGNLIPREILDEFWKSVGLLDNEGHEGGTTLLEARELQSDLLLSLQNVSAFVGTSHMQYLVSREAIESLSMRWADKAMMSKGETVDRPLDESGFLRLSTPEACVYHIGNVITEDWLLQEFRRLVSSAVPGRQDQRTRSSWFWRQRLVRQALRRIYTWSFNRFLGNSKDGR